MSGPFENFEPEPERTSRADAVEATQSWTFDGPWPENDHFRILFEGSCQATCDTEIAAEGLVVALNADRSVYDDLRDDVKRLEGERDALRTALGGTAVAMEHTAEHLRATPVSLSLEADDLNTGAAKARAALTKETQ